jgi:uncharacterized protein YqeY
MAKQELKDKIRASLQKAEKKQEQRTVRTLRLLEAAIRDREQANGKDEQSVLANQDVVDILTHMIDQRRQAIVDYKARGKTELAEQEKQEIAILSDFMPQQMNDQEMHQACRQTIEDLDAKGLRDVGRCVTILKERYQGQLNLCKASSLVKTMLQ